MFDEYKEQAALILRILPFIAEEKIFALKGGTAINLFIQNLPRLSVDIDLSYLLFDDRDTALSNIAHALKRIKRRVEGAYDDIRIDPIPKKEGGITKLQVNSSRGAQIKIEVNTIMRGRLFDSEIGTTVMKVSEVFDTLVEMNIISYGELYGGKLCAALDRQHPRDLFDIHYLFNGGGISAEIKQGFIAALLSHPRPLNEVLSPNFTDQQNAFDNKFSGMALSPFSYADYVDTREHLLAVLKKLFNDNDKVFLLSYKACSPDWDLMEIENLSKLPAVQWKLLNLQKLQKTNPRKYQEHYASLELVLANY